MPLYAFETTGNTNGLERILLSFPKGTDMQSAMQYVAHHYACNPRPIRLMEPVDNSVTEIIKQSVHVAPASNEDADEDGEPIDVDANSEEEFLDGSNDRQ